VQATQLYYFFLQYDSIHSDQIIVISLMSPMMFVLLEVFMRDRY